MPHRPPRPLPRPASRPCPPTKAGALPSLLLAALLVLALGACGSDRERDADAGPLADRAALRGASYVVGGGPTTELRLLCHLTIAAVEAAGASAVDECGKVGEFDVRLGPERSDVDTGWAALHALDRDGDLRPEPPGPPGPAREADARRGVTWLAPTVAGDTDVVVGRPGGPATVSALVAAGDAVLCAPDDGPAREVLARYRGADPLAPATAVRVLDLNAVLAGVATGRCTAGIVPGSSGRVPALGLVVLDDDRGVLGSGPAGRGGYVPLLRTPTFLGHPAVAGVLGEITGRLDDPALRGMVREVEVDGRDPRDAARRWLAAQGLITRS